MFHHWLFLWKTRTDFARLPGRCKHEFWKNRQTRCLKRLQAPAIIIVPQFQSKKQSHSLLQCKLTACPVMARSCKSAPSQSTLNGTIVDSCFRFYLWWLYGHVLCNRIMLPDWQRPFLQTHRQRPRHGWQETRPSDMLSDFMEKSRNGKPN